MHENEIPIALLTSQQAEINRDRKARKKPFSMDEFYIYPEDTDRDYIDPVYGAVARRLIELRQFPLWGLFIYKDLMKSPGVDKYVVPDILCYQSKEAILLAPQVNENVCRCMIIATEEASNRVLHMESPCGKTIKAKMPNINSKVYAEENCYVDIY